RIRQTGHVVQASHARQSARNSSLQGRFRNRQPGRARPVRTASPGEAKPAALEKRPMTMNVREATSRDLPRILEIERLAFPQPWSLDSFKRELMLPFSRIVVAAEGQAETRALPRGFLCRWLVADE